MPSTVLCVLVAAVFVISACAGTNTTSASAPAAPATPSPSASPSPFASSAPSSPSAAPSASAATCSPPPGEPCEITVGTDSAVDLKFDPAEVTVPTGVAVRLTFENRSSTEPHNLTFEEAPINVGTETIKLPGESETVEFTAPGPGEYPFVCTLHEDDMTGVLTVLD